MATTWRSDWTQPYCVAPRTSYATHLACLLLAMTGRSAGVDHTSFSDQHFTIRYGANICVFTRCVCKGVCKGIKQAEALYGAGGRDVDPCLVSSTRV